MSDDFFLSATGHNPSMPERLRLTAIYPERIQATDWQLDTIREAADVIEKIMEVRSRQSNLRDEKAWADAFYEIGMILERSRHEWWKGRK